MSGNPNPSPETRFQPGQSGNPGGMSKELRALINENAAKATRIRAALLDKLIAQIDELAKVDPSQLPNVTGLEDFNLTGELLKLVKDSEDRGLGSPTQTIAGDPEAPLFPTKVTLAGPDGGNT